VGMGDDFEVAASLSPAEWFNVCAVGAPPLAFLSHELEESYPEEIFGVDINIFVTEFNETLVDMVHILRASGEPLDGLRTSSSMELRVLGYLWVEVILGFLEVRKHVGVTPANVSKVAPTVEVPRVASDVHHGVYGRRAT